MTRGCSVDVLVFILIPLLFFLPEGAREQLLLKSLLLDPECRFFFLGDHPCPWRHDYGLPVVSCESPVVFLWSSSGLPIILC
eukprot:CCRYP_021102-RA/>CCRYP_021102-RA protein AED:0.47 eAED:0.47 QI:36/1/1/1/0/0/2/19/81